MRKRKRSKLSVLIVVMSTYFIFSSIMVYADAAALKKGSTGKEVVHLQENLKALGYFNANATGYYGDITETAVKRLQQSNGLYCDGVSGNNTVRMIDCLVSSLDVPLKKGMSGISVEAIQSNLKYLGFFDASETGYYGDITENSVKSFQNFCGLTGDGIAGSNTLSAVRSVLFGSSSPVSRTSVQRTGDYKLNWFEEVQGIFTLGSAATIYDIDTGLSFNIKRSYGTNHADCETLTTEDTAIMKKIYGGEWSWSRRAIIISVNGEKIAASMNGMPHAGLDKYSEGKYVSGRSGGYGYGYNFDAVKGNGIDGHFCIHFYRSRTHGSNKIDSQHQEMVEKAAAWAESNY